MEGGKCWNRSSFDFGLADSALLLCLLTVRGSEAGVDPEVLSCVPPHSLLLTWVDQGPPVWWLMGFQKHSPLILPEKSHT